MANDPAAYRGSEGRLQLETLANRAFIDGFSAFEIPGDCCEPFQTQGRITGANTTDVH